VDERGYVAQALFDRLLERDIEFCVLGDVQNIPEAIASDLDMAVPAREFEQMPATLWQFCRDFGLQLVQMIRHERSACYFVIAWRDSVGGLRYLAPDFCSDYRRAGRLLLSADELLARRQPALDPYGRERNLPVPAADVQFIYYLTKKVDKLELNAGHGAYLSRQWQADPDGALRRMVRFWPELADNGLIAHAATLNQWAGVQAALPQLRRALQRSTSLSPFDAVAEAGRAFGRVLRPTGMTVAFIGPDGSGKSTLIERVTADLAPAFRRTMKLHLRPRLLAPGASAAPVADPYAAPARGAMASVAKLAWFVADYLAGYALRVQPCVIRSGLVAFDRYFHDLLADPKRYRYGASEELARAAAWLVPAPGLWVVLDAPVPVLQERKQEVGEEAAALQRRAYLALAARVGDAVVIDASRGPATVASDATQAILARLEGRIERRHVPAFAENPLGARVLLFVCRHKVPLIGKLVRLLFNSDIYCRVRSAIRMPHPYGIVIHSKARIGSGVTVMQQVTIGSKDPGENVAPVLEDDVYVGAGAKVLGGIRIGRGVVIGANAVVTRDVPSYCTVVGANRILRKAGRDADREDTDAEDPAREAQSSLQES
jgi:serine acetyltransferase/thymidylate kinase